MQTMVRANDDKLDDTVENLRTATDNLDQLTDSLKQRPWSLIRIKQPKERELPQQKRGQDENETDRNLSRTNCPDAFVRLWRGGEISKLLHSGRSAAARSTGTGKHSCDSRRP
jgi:hypothetical protein